MPSEPARATDECRSELRAATPDAEPSATVDELQRQLRRAESELHASVTERNRVEAQLAQRRRRTLAHRCPQRPHGNLTEVVPTRSPERNRP